MKKNLISLHFIALSVTVFLTACGSTVPLYDKSTEPPPAQTTSIPAAPANVAANASAINGANIQQQATQPPSGAKQTFTVSGLVVQFAYDSSSIDPQYRDVIQSNAQLLRSNTQVRVMLEGHADERGDNEYNLSLGSQRAETVKQALIALGASAAQIETVSYGEERPKVEGSNEEAWAQNRRVEFNYNKK